MIQINPDRSYRFDYCLLLPLQYRDDYLPKMNLARPFQHLPAQLLPTLFQLSNSSGMISPLLRDSKSECRNSKSPGCLPPQIVKRKGPRAYCTPSPSSQQLLRNLLLIGENGILDFEYGRLMVKSAEKGARESVC
jgi:hypothetical protein